ncbi:MAG: translation initiation factor IF-2 [Bdellovibrionales bacterium]|nr:translation initiation factor IF-2 [Bdellovibrionales bacterium]
MKVYELAKELGLDSISLLDKLNTLNIKVKNHMSDLGAEEVTTARASLGKKAEAPAKKTTTAARVRKKAADPAVATPATPAPAPTAAAAPSASAKSASAVIRRRVKSDGEVETMVPASVAKPAEVAAPVVEAAPVEAPAPQQEEAPAQVETQVAQTPAETVQAAATPTPAEEAQKTKKPIILTPRPVAPRKSILTVHDAPAVPVRPTIKPATPGVKPAAKPGSANDKDGFRIIKMTKENLDQMVEEEAAKKRGGGREAEIRPEDVRFADYRKKEMVFLPRKKKLPVGREVKKTEITTPNAAKRVVEVNHTITVQELAAQLSVKAGDVIRKLMAMGTMATMNQSLDFDTATVIAGEYQYEVKDVSFREETMIEDTKKDAADTLVARPPVVTIMGHVDHGKTSLLDSIREANVAAGETGGITQHIGAYTVEKNGKLITFIDTPGHEAFTTMRARGANVTDIVILVVAADDGVMPQTREALSHAKAAGVPIIVAVNKMDKPGANPEKVKQALAELDLLAEDWGGQNIFVPVSAVKKTGIDKLLESILLVAEVSDLKANPEAAASGTVLEARVEKGRGPVVSLLVKRGTLKVGDALVAGTFAGRVKAMIDDKGRTLKELTPAMAAEVLGFEGTPSAGEKFDSPESEIIAREIASNRNLKNKAPVAAGKVSLDDLFSKIQSGTMKELNVILKADVFGSVEAIRESLSKLATDKVKVKVILAAPGGISESDVLLASASQAIIIGFNVRPETKARQLAEAEHIEIKSYGIIYELLEDIKKSMAGLLDKKKVEKFLGRAEVRQTFSVPKVGTIAGCAVVDGKIIRGANVRLLRESRIIYDGKMSSLKRFKDDAKEVAEGFECGIGLESYNDLKTGDLIEAYQIDWIAPELNA